MIEDGKVNHASLSFSASQLVAVHWLFRPSYNIGQSIGCGCHSVTVGLSHRARVIANGAGKDSALIQDFAYDDGFYNSVPALIIIRPPVLCPAQVDIA
jgi:hypothetical protein